MNLSEHLNHDPSKLYKPGEFNNALHFLYTAIGAAVHDKADKLVIKSNGFEWYKGDAVLGTFLGRDLPIPEPSYNANLHKLLERDALLNQHLEIAAENFEETIVNIKYPYLNIELADEIPHQPTVDMLQCAYPEGIPDSHYLPLLSILVQNMSMRVLSAVIADIKGGHYTDYMNDVARAGSFRADPRFMVAAMHQLIKCGYADWLENS
jgi:hypothetical protein